MATSKEIFDAYIATTQHVREPDLSLARLKVVSDLIHLKIPEAVVVPNSSQTFCWVMHHNGTRAYVHDSQNNEEKPVFVSEGGWVKVPVYLNINQTATYAGSLIVNFNDCNNRHHIPVCFSNRLVEALYSGNGANGLKQVDIDLAKAEEELRKTIVAASSGNGKKLGATEHDVISNIDSQNRNLGYLCWNMFDFLRVQKNNPFQKKSSISDALKLQHFEQLEVLKNLLVSPETSQGSVQKLKDLNAKINPWVTTGHLLMIFGIILIVAGFAGLFFLFESTLLASTVDTLIGLVDILIFVGPILMLVGSELSREKFELTPAILNADSTAHLRPKVIVEPEQVSFKTSMQNHNPNPYYPSMGQECQDGNSWQLYPNPYAANTSSAPVGNFHAPTVSQPLYPHTQQYGYPSQVNPQPYQPANPGTHQLGTSDYPPGYPPGYQVN